MHNWVAAVLCLLGPERKENDAAPHTPVVCNRMRSASLSRRQARGRCPKHHHRRYPRTNTKGSKPPTVPPSFRRLARAVNNGGSTHRTLTLPTFPFLSSSAKSLFFSLCSMPRPSGKLVSKGGLVPHRPGTKRHTFHALSFELWLSEFNASQLHLFFEA
jgi:hypothetical protein